MSVTIKAGVEDLGADHVMTTWGPKPRRLTERERDVLETFVDLESVKGAAGALGISVKTVEYHLSVIRSKLGATTLIGLVKCVIHGKHYETHQDNRI